MLILLFIFSISISNLLDLTGSFYLIHPFEEKIKRNVLNNIIEFDNKKINLINIKYHKYLLSYLFSLGLIVDYNADSLYGGTSLYEFESKNRIWVKTELGQKVCELINKFETTIPDAITLISAKAMDCLTEVLEIKTLLEIIQFDLKKIKSLNKRAIIKPRRIVRRYQKITPRSNAFNDFII